MNRTVTALYETRAQAEQARGALQAAGLGQKVDIQDKSGEGQAAQAHHGGLLGWLGDLFGGHHDQHLYDEGLRRGHFLLVAKVDDLNETRAAEILDAATPVDLTGAGQSWRAEGWTPPAAAAAPPAASTPLTPPTDGIAQGLDPAPPATTSPPPGDLNDPKQIGAGVRTYPVTGLG